MLNYSNPYDVLSETISFENVQLMAEMITLKTLRTRYVYARKALDWLYVGLVKDLNRGNDSEHVFSDAYDLVQNAVCFLCEFVGKKLTDAYMVKNGQEITIKQATYSLVGRNIDRMSRHFDRSQDINDYTEVDNTIERLGLKPRDRVVLDCYMAGMTCNEIAEFLDISCITVWRRRTPAQVKYKSLFF